MTEEQNSPQTGAPKKQHAWPSMILIAVIAAGLSVGGLEIYSLFFSDQSKQESLNLEPLEKKLESQSEKIRELSANVKTLEEKLAALEEQRTAPKNQEDFPQIQQNTERLEQLDTLHQDIRTKLENLNVAKDKDSEAQRFTEQQKEALQMLFVVKLRSGLDLSSALYPYSDLISTLINNEVALAQPLSALQGANAMDKTPLTSMLLAELPALYTELNELQQDSDTGIKRLLKGWITVRSAGYEQAQSALKDYFTEATQALEALDYKGAETALKKIDLGLAARSQSLTVYLKQLNARALRADAALALDHWAAAQKS